MAWRTRWIMWRNAMLASPGFQRFAARFPITRPVARAKARALFDLVAGFTYSQTLAAVIETGWLDRLAEAPRDVESLAGQADLSTEGAERLLKAAAAIDLTERLNDGRWTLGQAGAALRGNAGIAEMVRHHHHLYADLADPLALLRRGGAGELSEYWRYARATGTGSAQEVAEYSALMAASQPMVADQVIDAYRFGRHRRVMDVGGGEGAFLARLAARVDGPELALFDLPSVVDRAAARLASAGVADRVRLHRGSFLADPLPQGADCITLVRILHDHDDEPAQQLLRNVHAALPAGGRVVIAEPMADTPSARAMGDAYFGWYLLAMGSGRPRPAREIKAMLAASGFTQIRRIQTAMPVTASMIIASR
ncbi:MULTISPECIES: methyltransferase [unclassified Sphingomonas]|jgi:demethylspheroidene O-methyltransferase|uniref:methyltransferase n=1 Tax=unclassified Sphingomonas TaxID=196159 RepID=UPI00082DFE91|nr:MULTISPECIES: methyltransferase [unclassified Sphingomonas]MCH4891952.1 methyltransferase domain-containing protein [Sphingomonas sp. SFZ2018-12]